MTLDNVDLTTIPTEDLFDELERRNNIQSELILAEVDRRRKLAIMLYGYPEDKPWTCVDCGSVFVVGQPTKYIFSEKQMLFCAHCTEPSAVLGGEYTLGKMS